MTRLVPAALFAITGIAAATAAGAQQPARPAALPSAAAGDAVAGAREGAATGRPAFKKITRAQFDALLKDPGKVLVLDVRRPDELQTIGGFPVYVSIQAKDLEQRLAYLPKDRAIITVSNHAGRAGRAAELLQKHGFKVAGSIGAQDYEAEGGTLVKIAPPAPRDGQAATAAAAAGAAGAGAAAQGGRAAAAPQPPSPIDAATARRILAAAEQTAAAASAKVAIAVVDINGDLVALSRLDGASSRAVVSAQGKARAAILFGVPTKQVSDAIAAGTPLPVTVTPAAAGASGIVTNQGGVPLFIDGKLAGAVGVGGSSSAEDERFASAGVAAATGSARPASAPSPSASR
jgi:glc operon protein GlcG